MAVVEETRVPAPPWTAVLHDWVTTVDHKKIGVLYVLMAVIFMTLLIFGLDLAFSKGVLSLFDKS